MPKIHRTYLAFPINGSGLPFPKLANSNWVFDLFGHKSVILRQIYLDNKFWIWFFIFHLSQWQMTFVWTGLCTGLLSSFDGNSFAVNYYYTHILTISVSSGCGFSSALHSTCMYQCDFSSPMSAIGSYRHIWTAIIGCSLCWMCKRMRWFSMTHWLPAI
jgi:hypothetical protein